jgi:hypothetical protein
VNSPEGVGRPHQLDPRVDLLAYIDVFRSLAIIGAVMIPIVLPLKTIDLRAPARRPVTQCRCRQNVPELFAH